jgi:hypothetical protein
MIVVTCFSSLPFRLPERLDSPGVLGAGRGHQGLLLLPETVRRAEAVAPLPQLRPRRLRGVLARPSPRAPQRVGRAGSRVQQVSRKLNVVGDGHNGGKSVERLWRIASEVFIGR